jgi:single-stranded DNA-binding protein
MSGIEAAFFGALGRDAEPKVSAAGKPYLRANVRVGDGDAAQWVSVLAFDEKAIASADNFVKGARVYVEGRLTLGEYMAGDGSKRASLSCMSWHCRLAQIGRNRPKRQRDRSGEQTNNQAAPAQAVSDFSDEVPF